MHVLLYRRLPLLVLLCWMAPSFAAAATAMHVALDHHPAHAGEHQHLGQGQDEPTAPELFAGSHRHELESSPGGHPATLTAPVPMPMLAAESVVVEDATAPIGSDEERSSLVYSTRHGPPQALFTTHCTLLL